MAERSGLRLLVIDDEPDIIEVTRVSLELLGGHDVTTARSAREGIALAMATPPEAVPMDVNLPDMPALEAIHALGTTPATAQVPVILFSSEQAEATVRLREQPNVAGSIAKPFTVATLSDEVVRLIRSTGGS